MPWRCSTECRTGKQYQIEPIRVYVWLVFGGQSLGDLEELGYGLGMQQEMRKKYEGDDDTLFWLNV